MRIERLGDYQMLINDEGQVVYPPVADRIIDIGENLFAVLCHDKYGIINRKGKFVVPLEFEECSTFSNGLVKMGRGYSYYYFNKVGNLIYLASGADEASDYDGHKINITNYDEDEYTHERQIAYGEVYIDSIFEPHGDYRFVLDNLFKPKTKAKSSTSEKEIEKDNFKQGSIFDL